MRTVLILLGLLLSQPAWAEWVKLSEEKATMDGVDYINYWDPATLRKTPNGRRAWTMANFDSAPKSSTARSLRTLTEYDCTAERLRILQQTAYSGEMLTGETVQSINNPNPWSYVAPGTVGAMELSVFCKARLPK
jgi:hypothetical protein